MKNRSSLLRVVHLLIICGNLFCIPDNAIAAVRIVAFGDSITLGVPYDDGTWLGCRCPPEGYEVQLEEQMSSAGYNIEVYNYGIGGEKTYQGVVRLDSVLATAKPDYVLLMEGTNDLWASSPLSVKENLSIMIDKIRSWEAIPILATLTPDTRAIAKEILLTNDLIKELRDEKNVLFSDQYAAVVDNWSDLSDDELHPNIIGYGVLAETWGITLLQELKIITIDTAGNGEGSVTYNPPGESCTTCSLTYPPGTGITLSANPAQGSVFTGWSAETGCAGTGTCVVTMDADQSVTATFTLTYTVTPYANENGSIDPSTPRLLFTATPQL